MFSRSFAFKALIVIGCLANSHLLAQTQAYLDAPILAKDTDLAVTLSANKSSLAFRPSRQSNFQPSSENQLLLSRNSFRVAYFHYNPLSMKVSVGAVIADDPAQASLQKLLDALQTVATTVQPAQKKANEVETGKTNRVAPAPEIDASKKISDALDIAAAHLDDLKKGVPDWAPAVDAAWGPNVSEKQAVGAATDLIQTYQNSICIDDLKTKPNVLGDKSTLEGIKKGNLFKELGPLDVDGITLLQQFDQALATVTSTCTALAQLKRTLTDAESSNLWDSSGEALLLQPNIDATFAKQQTITVTVAFVQVDPLSLAVKETGTKVTGTFVIRRYRALLPEVGVGAVFSFLDRPKYGTGKDAAGNTVVALSGTDHVSIAPTIMLNFVCHCDAGGIAPMLQMGASTSTDLPAILIGAGFRLFGTGKGDVAIGGGLALGWYKDLNKLKVGQIIAGTADINGDLSFISTPKPASYLTIQYKF